MHRGRRTQRRSPPFFFCTPRRFEYTTGTVGRTAISGVIQVVRPVPHLSHRSRSPLMFRRTLAGCLAALVAVGLAGASPGPAARPVVLTPAAAPVPALKCALLPPLRERRPGNAAPLYRKAAQGFT